MTDLDTDRLALMEVLDRLGIVPTLEGNDVVLTANETPRVEGYAGFETRFEFDSGGKFKTIRIWE